MEQQSDPSAEIPAQDPDQSQVSGEQPTAEAKAQTPARPAQRPAREDSASKSALNDRGQAVDQALQRVAAPHVLNAGGRDEIPWIEVSPERLVDVARLCKEHQDLRMEMLHCLLAVDYQEYIELVYILFSLAMNHKAMIKVNLPFTDDGPNPQVDSVVSLWEAAGWYEREAHDLFGVEFPGNPNMEPLLLYEGFEGFPGRKSFPFHKYKEY
jgi:NADH-quinone oxidoreductase subunit C